MNDPQNLDSYRILDTGHKCKLEQVGPYRLIRPALNAFWHPALPAAEWEKADGILERTSEGDGVWQWRKKLPEFWLAKWGGFTLKMKPTNFGHLGFFAEQYQNWDFFREFLPAVGAPEVKALNLFAYSGIGSMAMAQGGATVTHVDAAKGMIEWGQENMLLNPQVPNKIRWMVDDVNKFCAREIRRGNKYSGIALDPPSFGRGNKGQVWKIEEHLPDLLKMCNELLDKHHPYFVVLSCHSPGFSPISLGRMLSEVFGDGRVECGEMTVPEHAGKLLPAGISCRFIGNAKK
ncbi:MAG: class I SAM-dependent methyltransferase [Victivallaceae bacterium]